MNKSLSKELKAFNMLLQADKASLKENRDSLEKSVSQVTNAKTFKLWNKLKKIKQNAVYLLNPHVWMQVIRSESLSEAVYKVSRDEQKYITQLHAQKNTSVYSNVTIIIPTYNGEKELPLLLKSISAQKGIEDPEVLIIDSGSTDKTLTIAKEYGARVVKIPQSEFNHGLTRNKAAQLAKGNFLIFTVQDAIPLEHDTFHKLLTVLTSENDIAGVSTKQVPFPDADMFAKWQIKNHVHALRLEGITYVSHMPPHTDFLSLPFYAKRKITLLDDVCCAVKKELFEKIGGYKEMHFAEDVDYAIRAIQSGYKIGFVGTTGVIHSHTRPAEYFFRRYYADVLSVNSLLHEPGSTVCSSLTDYLSSATGLVTYVKEHIAVFIPEGASAQTVSTLQSQEILDQLQKLTGLHEDYVENTAFISGFTHLAKEGISLFETEYFSHEQIVQYIEKLLAGFLGIQLALYVENVPVKERESINNLILKNV